MKILFIVITRIVCKNYSCTSFMLIWQREQPKLERKLVIIIVCTQLVNVSKKEEKNIDSLIYFLYVWFQTQQSCVDITKNKATDRSKKGGNNESWEREKKSKLKFMKRISCTICGKVCGKWFCVELLEKIC